MPGITDARQGDRTSPVAAAPVPRRLRVLMGVPAPGAVAGGPALHLPMLVGDLRQRGDGEVVTMPYGRWSEGGALPLKVWHQVIDVARSPSRLRRAAPDLVHLSTALDRKTLLRDIVFVLLTRAMSRRVFLKWHGSQTELLAGGGHGWRPRARCLLRSVDALGVLNQQELEEVEQCTGAPGCFVVKNALDPARSVARTGLHAQFGIRRGAPLLLFIGRLIASKGLEDFLRALPPVVARFGAHLLVVGDGPSRGPAQRLAAALGVGACVHFLGAVSEDEAVRFYNGADVFVFPSFHPEGFPMALLQSVVAGLGIVSTPLSAAVEHRRGPDNCLFVQPKSPETVAAALERLLADDTLLRRMRENNRSLSARFERTAVAAEFSQIYRDVTQGARPPTCAVSHAAARGAARRAA